jgi:hypothetical protein
LAADADDDADASMGFLLSGLLLAAVVNDTEEVRIIVNLT